MSDIKLMTQADVAKAIPLLAADAKSVQDRIHVIACSTLDHVRAHGDTTGCVALCNALPNGQRVKALAYWFKHFSTSKLILTFDKKAKAWVAKLSKERSDEDFKISAAMAESFADLTDEKNPESLTLAKLIKKLESYATNSDDFEGTDIPKVAADARALSAELVAFIRAKSAAPKAA